MVAWRLALASLGTSGLGSVIEDDVLTRTGVPQGESSLGLTWTLNAAGSLEFTLPIDDPFVTRDNFAVGAREFHVYRDEVLVWGGRLWRAEVTNVVAVRFGALGFFSSLNRREVDDDLLYNNVDQLDIAWNLIDFTQAKTDGDLGITREDATPSGVDRSVAYCLDTRDVIADAIGDLSEAEDGFDFDVGPDKVWRTWSPLRGTDTGIMLDTRTNVMSMDGLAFDATDLSNEVTAISSSGSCETPVTEMALDTTSRGIFGLLQSNLTDDVPPAHLQAKADEALRISREPRLQPTVTMDQAVADLVDVPDLSTYAVGDLVHLTSTRGFATFDDDLRILEISVLARPGGLERVTLRLDSVLP